MSDANNKLTVYVSLHVSEDYVGAEEMQLVNNQLAELIGQVIRFEDDNEV